MHLALGLRAHSGWAALVAAAGTLEAPRILDRRRIFIADPELTGSKQPYHAAAELPLPQAEAHLAQARESSEALAEEALTATIKSLNRQGHKITAIALILGSGKPLPPLESILAAHTLIHTAEGIHFRDALASAAHRLNLPLTCVREKDLDPAALKHLHSLGKLIGPPWTQDQKFATIAALQALASLPVPAPVPA